MSESAAIVPGLYRHFKGGVYRVVGIARHSESDEPHVVYQPLGKSEAGLWVRPLTMFAETVATPAGPAPRFAPLPPEAARVVADLAELPGVTCPCGTARRAFADVPGSPVSVHRVEIATDARTHYHREHTEVYVVLDCADGAAIELDGERVPVRPGSAILIPPRVRHRTVGRMTILNIVAPPFDPADEWED